MVWLEFASAVKVKGSAVDLDVGETMILTLADTDILAEDGTIAEDADVLENYDKLQQDQIDKAKRCAAVVLNSPKYRLGHPENCLFYYLKKDFWMKVSKKYLFTFETGCTSVQAACAVIWSLVLPVC